MSRPRLSIRNRLLALGLVPLLALLFIGTISLRGVLAERAETQQLVSLVGLSSRVSDLVHALQGERGMTSGFVTSKGAKMADTLPTARQGTDAAAASVTQYLADHSDLPQDVRGTTEAAMNTLRTTLGERAGADAFAKPAPEYVAAYTKPVDGLLEALASVTYATTNADLTRDLGALAALASAKESTGLERAQLNAALTAKKFAPGQAERVTGLLNQRAAYLGTYVLLGGAEVKDDVEAMQSSAAVTKVRELETAALAAGGPTGDSTAWFAAATSYIDAMRGLEKHGQ